MTSARTAQGLSTAALVTAAVMGYGGWPEMAAVVIALVAIAYAILSLRERP